jgi:hypothetical protein
MKNLPLEIVDFSEIRNADKNYYYADKTHHLYEVLNLHMPQCLCRPRRFGKSLLVSTLKAILEGRRELFKGLWIDGSDYDWKPYPVIRLEMNLIESSSVESMNSSLLNYLDQIAKREGLIIEGSSPSSFLMSLIWELYAKYDQKVCLLIDEHDAPFLKNINNPDLADKIRKKLIQFYMLVKSDGEKLRRVFMTGVSRFITTSIFSSLNNIHYITFDPCFADICGFNYEEFNVLFEDRLDFALEQLKIKKIIAHNATGKHLRALIQQWYDGYSWDGETKVYNPYSLLSFFNQLEFSDFWYQTGSPTFLKHPKDSQPRVFDLSKGLLPINGSDVKIDEIDELEPASLMLQTGYLTVKERLRKGIYESDFNLCLPNLEVKASFIPLTLSIDRPNNLLSAKKLSEQMMAALFKRDAARVEKALSGYLTLHNFDSHTSEKYCFTLLLSALLMADQCPERDYDAKGDCVVSLKSPSSDHYMIEVTYLPVQQSAKKEAQKTGTPKIQQLETKANPTKRTKTQSDGTPARAKKQTEQKKQEQEKPDLKKIRLKMSDLAKESIARIYKKYYRFDLRRSKRVFNVAVVVSGQDDVLVKFEEDVN